MAKKYTAEQQAELDRLSSEKLELGSIRSLKGDDRFQRWFNGFVRRYEMTHGDVDQISADDAVSIAELKGIRKTFANEIRIIENAEARINVIDKTIEGMKQNNHRTNGTEGRSLSAPPKE